MLSVPEKRIIVCVETKQAYMLEMQEFKLQNIVGSCDVKFPIRLEGLAFAHEKFCSVGHCIVHNSLSPNRSLCANVIHK